MLSKNQVVKVRKALEKMYKDECDIIEHRRYTKDNGATGFEDVTVSSKQPCRLSFNSSEASVPDEAASTVSQNITLFISPDITIKSGSKIMVTHLGVTTAYTNSGEPKTYNTHQEVILELFEEWS